MRHTNRIEDDGEYYHIEEKIQTSSTKRSHTHTHTHTHTQFLISASTTKLTDCRNGSSVTDLRQH